MMYLWVFAWMFLFFTTEDTEFIHIQYILPS